IAAASAASHGLPNTSSSSTTSVFAPSTRTSASPASAASPARALSRATRLTYSRGDSCAARRSGTSTSTTRNATPSWVSSSRRRGDCEARWSMWRPSECERVFAELRVALPAQRFVQRLRGQVVVRGGEREAGRTLVPCLRGGGFQQGLRHALPPCRGGHEQVVEQPGTHHAHRGKQRIELGKAQRRAVRVAGQQDHRLAEAQTGGEEIARPRLVGRLAVEPAVAIEQRHQRIEVVEGGAAYLERHGLSLWRRRECPAYRHVRW